MRKLLLVIILIILPISGLHAQDVWKEGTHWDVECYSSIDSFIKYQFAFELSGHIEIGGVDYLKLIDLNEDQTIAYIRTERGDTVVYARYIRGQDYNEFVLYDFGSFDPGTCFQYSTWDGETWENGYPVYSLEPDTIKEEGLTYYHDVIVDGDTLPCWNQVLFKVGCLDGPMAYVYDPLENSPARPFGEDGKPKRRNVSHTVLRLADRTMEFMPDGIITVKINKFTQGVCYDLQGRRLTSAPEKGFYILNGKKYIK